MFLARLKSAKNAAASRTLPSLASSSIRLRRTIDAAGGLTMKASTFFSLPICPNNRGHLCRGQRKIRNRP